MPPLSRPLFLALLSVLGLCHATATAIGPTTDLVISNKVISPDGFPRSAVVAGGTLPGPLIRGKKGSRFKINVINQLEEDSMITGTSVHWHGIFQTKSNWADGVSFVTQCPITANNSFLYDFSTGDQTNTFWYHSHMGLQYCDGLRGPLVIYDDHDPYKHLYDIDDESTIITLMDWYHVPATGIGHDTYPDSTLINGLGRTVNGTSPLSIIHVEHGKRYRMRLISMACVPYYNFTIDGHEHLTVIEADGNPTLPLVVNTIPILSAQRYSFILEANQKVGNYWVRAAPNFGYQGFESGINSAILRYKGAPAKEPTTSTHKPPNVKLLREIDLRPLVPNPRAPGKPWIGGADVNINLAMSYNDSLGTQGLFTMNGVPLYYPRVPVLLQILSGAQAAKDLLPSGTLYTLPPNKVIEISMPPGDAPADPHPFHLHGHSFSVVRGPGTNDTNFINPVIRDTVNTGFPGDNVTIRFVTDNSGPWFLHCHIDTHLDEGLAVVFAEDPEGTASDFVPSAQWDQLCPTYYQQSSKQP